MFEDKSYEELEKIVYDDPRYIDLDYDTKQRLLRLMDRMKFLEYLEERQIDTTKYEVTNESDKGDFIIVNLIIVLEITVLFLVIFLILGG